MALKDPVPIASISSHHDCPEWYCDPEDRCAHRAIVCALRREKISIFELNDRISRTFLPSTASVASEESNQNGWPDQACSLTSPVTYASSGHEGQANAEIGEVGDQEYSLT